VEIAGTHIDSYRAIKLVCVVLVAAFYYYNNTILSLLEKLGFGINAAINKCKLMTDKIDDG
jgi:hypothetical protein